MPWSGTSCRDQFFKSCLRTGNDIIPDFRVAKSGIHFHPNECSKPAQKNSSIFLGCTADEFTIILIGFFSNWALIQCHVIFSAQFLGTFQTCTLCPVPLFFPTTCVFQHQLQSTMGYSPSPLHGAVNSSHTAVTWIRITGLFGLK